MVYILFFFCFLEFEGNHHEFIEANNILLKNKKFTDDYLVAVDSYFYPSPAVPPPKYSTIEDFLITDSEEDDLTKIPVKYQVIT